MKRFISRKQKIIITAIDIVNKYGIKGLTTKKIAEEEGISEPAIYRHFKDKDEIIMSIIEEFNKFDKKIMNTIIEQNMDTISGLKYLANRYAEYYDNYVEITSFIFSFDGYKYNKETNEKVKEIYEKRSEFITDLISKGQENNIISNMLDANLFAKLYIGVIFYFTYEKSLYNRDKYLEEVNEVIDYIIKI